MRASFALFTPICASPLCCFHTWTGGALCSSEQTTTRSHVVTQAIPLPVLPLGRFLERIISTHCFHFLICYALTVFVWLLSPLTIALVPKFRGHPWTSAALDIVSTPQRKPFPPLTNMIHFLFRSFQSLVMAVCQALLGAGDAGTPRPHSPGSLSSGSSLSWIEKHSNV